MRIAVVLGTRPEIIKMSPIIRECERLNLDFFVLHSGQHYSYNMDRVFFEQLRLRDAKHNLEVGSGTHAEQTGKILIGVERVLMQEQPDVVLVEGDTNTVLAGALAAVKLGISIGHVEAGLRSYDREMPEEINRILADHCSDLLFAPTETSRRTLLGEGIPEQKVFVTGNTVVDAVYQNLEIAERRTDVLAKLHLEPHSYFLTTIHRQENVDNPTRLGGTIKGLEKVQEEFNLPVVCPVHPRTIKQMTAFGYKAERLRLTEPLDYLSFLLLEKNAKLILTDSGGVQEEACILRVPCVTLRNSTERPETLDVGANILSKIEPQDILASVRCMLGRNMSWENPFGDGKAGKKIVQVLSDRIV